MPPVHSLSRQILAFAIVLSGTLIGIAGTDLVLPAIPSLPATLGGSEATAQLVIAAFTAGLAFGLLVAGELGAIIEARRLLCLSLLAYGIISLIAATATSIEVLIPMRFVQGIFGATPAVFAPSFIRRLSDETRAVRMLGTFTSIESLVPGFAPIAGAALVALFGWRSTFYVIAIIGLPAAGILALVPDVLPAIPKSAPGGSLLRLLRDRRYMRYALSQSLTLGAILVFVFGSPTVFTHSMGASVNAFLALQGIGVAFFIVAVNVTPTLANRYGNEIMVVVGTWISAAGILLIAAYALCGGNNAYLVPIPWILANVGFGLRSPPGFYAALRAADGNEARGAALIFLGFLAIGAIGTTLVAPFITAGLIALSLGASIFAIGAVACLFVFRA